MLNTLAGILGLATQPAPVVRASVDLTPHSVKLQDSVQDEFCVPVVVTDGPSLRLAEATAGKGVVPLA